MNKITRNEKGTVQVDGKAVCTVPADRSMLSVFDGNSSVLVGGDYRTDGWIYLDGKRMKKYLVRQEGVRFWEPVKKDIAKLEARYWKVLEYARKHFVETWRPAAEALVKVKKAHVKVEELAKSQNIDPWRLYNGRPTTDSDWGGISFDWVPTPKKPVHLKIGTTYYNVSNRQDELWGRVSKFRKILELAIGGLLFSKEHRPTTREFGRTLKLTINGRIYWYTCVSQGVAWWQKINWPEDMEVNCLTTKDG